GGAVAEGSCGHRRLSPAPAQTGTRHLPRVGRVLEVGSVRSVAGSTLSPYGSDHGVARGPRACLRPGGSEGDPTARFRAPNGRRNGPPHRRGAPTTCRFVEPGRQRAAASSVAAD